MNFNVPQTSHMNGLCWQQPENSEREFKTPKYLCNYNAEKVIHFVAMTFLNFISNRPITQPAINLFNYSITSVLTLRETKNKTCYSNIANI